MRDSRVRLQGGRELAYADLGESGRPCAFFFHGAPSSRLRLAYLEQAFMEHGIRVLCPERPGYGRSTRQPGRWLDDWPLDVEALANELGVERFIVAGHSSGAPYALACAAQLPDRVVATVTLGGVTDMAWPDAWRDYVASEALLMRMPDEDVVLQWCAKHYGADGSGFMAASDFEFSEPDRALYADEKKRPFLAASGAEMFRQGLAGYAQDVFVQGRPWTFHPSAIPSPIDVVHGELDTLVPLRHSQHTAQLVAGSTLRVLPGHGHLTVLEELPALASAHASSLS